MSEGLNFTISGDSSKAASEIEKLKDKVASLTASMEMMRNKSKKITGDMVTDFKGIAISVENVDKNLAKLHMGHHKLRFAQLQMTNDAFFPKMANQIKTTESATSALISKTLSFAGAIGLASKGLAIYLDHAREMRALSDSLSTQTGNATSRAMVGGNISAGDKGMVNAKIQSMADIASTSVEKSGKFTEKLTSANVSPANFGKWKNAYKSITSTKSEDPAGLAESLMTMLQKEGINPADASEEDINRNVALLGKTFGLESSHAYNALSGSNAKLSNLDNFALISLMKERTSGNIRAATSKVKQATEKGINSGTFKELGITKSDLEKRKSELSTGGDKYMADTFALASSSPDAITDKAKTRDTIMFGQNVGPTEEQRAMYNRQYDKNKGSSGIVGWAMSKVWSQEEAYELQDKAGKAYDAFTIPYNERKASEYKGPYSSEREQFVMDQFEAEQKKAILDAIKLQNASAQKKAASRPINTKDSK